MSLPPCHSRHSLPGEEVWYACSHPQVIAPARRVHAGICVMCQYSSQPPPAQPVDADTLERAARPGPCVHLGEQVGERFCSTCRGSVRWKVFRCGHPRHGETILTECETCADYRPPERKEPESKAVADDVVQ